ncbi:hypothetical protein A0257_00910 [Hymenobacter psoromatis]|nr:hypothetical protein A0257_00910 [Hymenobacter psoromatis]
METLPTHLSDYELERGKPMPSFNHSIVQLNIGSELRSRLRQTHTITSELNLELNGKKMVPDLAIFSKLTPDMQHDILWVQDVPLTTIEILSPKQDLNSLLEKARLFLAAGVKSCWIVLPAVGTLAVFTGPTTYRSFTNGGAVVDEVLGVEIPLADIFS